MQQIDATYLGFLDAKVALITVFGFNQEAVKKSNYPLEVEISIKFPNSQSRGLK